MRRPQKAARVSLSLEELRTRVVAIPGDLVLCPKCREPLFRFIHARLRRGRVPSGREALQIVAGPDSTLLRVWRRGHPAGDLPREHRGCRSPTHARPLWLLDHHGPWIKERHGEDDSVS